MQDPQPLPADVVHLVRISAAVTALSAERVRGVLAEAVGAVQPVAIEELLLQLHLFVGFPRVLNAFAEWRELSGVAGPDKDVESGAPGQELQDWTARGDETCRAVYGLRYEPLRANVRALHPALDEWMVRDGYGRVLGRPGLPLRVRELCVVAACAASEQMPQLRSHLYGSLNCGSTGAELAAVLGALSDLIPEGQIAAARAELERVRSNEMERERRGAAEGAAELGGEACS